MDTALSDPYDVYETHLLRRMRETSLPDQPDGIDSDGRELPDAERAAERVGAYVEAIGDGLYDITPSGAPLYGRDLEVLSRAVLKGGAQ